MTATTLYLIRHGEADESTDDPGLTPLGRRQAAAVGERLAQLGVTEVLHSSRRRAVETAAIVAGSIPNAEPRHDVHAEDLTPVPAHFSDVPIQYHDFLRGVPPDERDIDGHRLDQAIEHLGRIGQADRTLLVVTHNFVIGWCVGHALDAPTWRWIGLNQSNGGITIIRHESGRPTRLVAFNDTGHL